MGVHEIYQLAIAIGLGLMVGLEREGKRSEIAGIRTFPMITAFGFLAGILAAPLGLWIPVGALLVTAGFLFLGNALLAQQGQASPGMTSEYAAMIMFMVGLALSQDWNALAVVASGVVLVLLQFKDPLRQLSERMKPAEMRALARLVLIGFVLFPAMPDRQYGPYGVLNPREIWLMVVLIVGISLGAYVAYRLLGGRAGALAGGILGGLISSTASTITFSRLTTKQGSLVPSAAVMILLASTVVFGRVVLEVALVSPEHLAVVAPPLLAMMAGMAGLVYLLFRRKGEAMQVPAPVEPPSDLRSAVVFGAVYGLVLVAVAFTRRHVGEEWLYAVSALSGLTDMDAITLSSAQLVLKGELSPDQAWRMILVGGMSNLVFKAGIVMSAGHRALRKPVLATFGAALALGTLLFLLWP
ncbi:MAG: MgtC/SapB family protein [Gemmatimonadales bacterium]|nr:MAG: MgtC/SapB family protein [Gemmatimonadales bacterium]